MVQINKWSIELVGSTDCFTSYAGVEMRMIIQQMDIKKDFRVELKKYPTNLYRDDKMKTMINNFKNDQQKQALKNLKLAKVNPIEGIVGGKSLSYDAVINLENFSYSYAKKTPTKIYPVVEIIKLEKGKEGLEVMKKQQNEQNAENFQKKKEASVEQSVKKTLQVDGKTKDAKLTSTIKKASKVIKKKVIKRKIIKKVKTGTVTKGKNL